MEIHRRAAKRPGAEDRVILREREPDVLADPEGGLVLRCENVPSWRDDGNHFDYDIVLTPDDLARLRELLAKL
jgi:hypothetical protein